MSLLLFSSVRPYIVFMYEFIGYYAQKDIVMASQSMRDYLNSTIRSHNFLSEVECKLITTTLKSLMSNNCEVFNENTFNLTVETVVNVLNEWGEKYRDAFPE